MGTGNIVTIARKELSIHLTTAIAYVVLGFYAFTLGILFVTSVNRFQQYTQLYVAQQKPELLEQLNFNDAIIVPMLSTGVWLLLFLVPILTMRLFAEEKAQRTFELLMTTPIRSVEMVLGKFLGILPLIGLIALLPLVYPWILHVYGVASTGGSSIEWAPVMSGCLFVLLLGGMFTSIGLLVSALSESQMLAAVITFAAILLLFILPMLASRLEGDWRSLIEYAAPLTHIARALRGRLQLADLVYFASTTVLFLFLAQRVVESHRWRS